MATSDGFSSAGTRVLTIRRARLARVTVISLAFTALGIWELTQPQLFDKIVGVVVIAFFGVLGIPLLAVQWIAPDRLEVDDDGFTLHVPLHRPMRRRWAEVSAFRTFSTPYVTPYGTVRRTRQQIVVYSTTAPGHRLLRRVNRGLSGDDEGLPPGFDGLTAAGLAQLLNDRRARAVRL